jgi:hypothetical protein
MHDKRPLQSVSDDELLNRLVQLLAQSRRSEVDLVTLSGIVKLAPHLTAQNRDELLRRASHRSKREIEVILAEMFPRPDAPTMVRKLPERRQLIPAPAGPCESQLRPGRVQPPEIPARAPVALVEPSQQLVTKCSSRQAPS